MVLPEVMLLDGEEIEALGKYVQGGGSLLASGRTSLVGADGTRHADFQLSEPFGVSYADETEEIVTYLRPEAGRR